MFQRMKNLLAAFFIFVLCNSVIRQYTPIEMPTGGNITGVDVSNYISLNLCK